MTDRLRMALAQVNPTVGDLAGNAALIRAWRAEAARAEADLVVFPELVIAGYPPEDLVLKPFFLDAVERFVHELAAETADGGPGVIIGAPWRVAHEGRPTGLANAALVLDGGTIQAVREKHFLPNYRVFDEVRLFTPGPYPGPVNFRDVRLGVMVCEDMWAPDIAETLAESGAEMLVAINGSPFETDKEDERLGHAVARAHETGLPLAYVNQIGGQDDLVFDGASFVLEADGALAARAPAFAEHLLVVDWVRGPDGWVPRNGERIAPPEGLELIWRALVTGLQDYVEKNGFPGVLIGLSGGIDSALTAALATDALGPERVRCVMMPSPYTSTDSLEDAAGCARMLGVHLDEIDIGPAMEAFDTMLGAPLGAAPEGITAENIQSRARGLSLMAMSNSLRWLVLATGNKSEVAVGYATLYGDMCGGYSVLKDVYKMTVFALSRWRNDHVTEGLKGPAGPVMPERIISKPPTAELRPNQRDEDSLPPYDRLDDILQSLIERELSVQEIVARGHDREEVTRVWRLLDLAEYKRRQAAPGPKITRRAFGKERRYPITNRFRAIATGD